MGTRFKGDTKDPAVNVTTWVLLVTIIFSVSARLVTKIRLFKRLTTDDLLIIASLLLGIGQSIVVSLAVESGYGKHSKDVSSAEMEQVMKNLWAGSLLYLLSLTFSKLSLVVFIRSLTPSAKDKWLARGVEVIIYAWVVVVILGTAFQCSLPHTWDFQNGQCFNLPIQLTWRYFIAISNIMTDLLIVAQAMILISSVQTTMGRRLGFAGIFLPRLFVTVATLVELAFIKKGTETNDPTFQMCEITIFEVLIQCLSIVTACWGQLNPFLSWMRSNGLKLDGVEEPTSWSYKMRSQSQSQGRCESRDHNVKFENKTFPLPMRRDQILVTQDWEVDSKSSQTHITGELETHP
ncbi:hypothetical protein PEX1_026430 [Penicillium expansum]|uniref:Rhodopsin domain-containing protein n=1 Tax=Penicillium expansum TaxID=27334 RepID=A0A0A2IVE2_PENEN|nr:hypothetical protein PEX2_100230 [Penicillium expansum]KGO36730.1 hypothetical protein PEXP_005290 [Penicillium expansum]KGO44115.1 hypothetical protein PEX1_026430 [Penicillium expansum]KGO60758.1 hypothetical protein PEX2_100230 [Penicillium expansum]